ncbi:hypothetical protein V8E36_009189 [Tilletia maclaganii]
MYRPQRVRPKLQRDTLPEGTRAVHGEATKIECTVCPNRVTNLNLTRMKEHASSKTHNSWVASFRRSTLYELKTAQAGPSRPPDPAGSEDTHSANAGNVGPHLDDGFDFHMPDESDDLYDPPPPPLRHQRTFQLLTSQSSAEGPVMGQRSAELLDAMLASAVSEVAPPVTDYDPFPDKVTFVLAAVSNHARRPLSTNRTKSMLLAFRLLGVPDVPSYSRYCRSMAEVRENLGSSIKQTVGGDGHKLYTKSLAKGLQSDFSNPMIRRQLQLYPRQAAVIKSYQESDRAFHQDKTKAPMVELAKGRHAYVDEVVELTNGHMLVQRWYENEYGDIVGRGLRANRRGHIVHVQEHELCVPLSSIRQTSLELAGAGGITKVYRNGREQKLLNPLRQVAQGRMVYSIPLYVFMDDLSGNRSKRWDKHLACYVQNAAIEAGYLGVDATIRLFAVSDRANAQEISEALVGELKELHEVGTICWDWKRQESVIVYAHVGVMIADNPMAAELASNIGMNGNHACRSCEAGGTTAERSTAAGMSSMTMPGPRRTMESIKRSLATQLQCAGSGATKTWEKEAKSTGVKDKLTTACCQRLVEEGQIRREEDNSDKEQISEELWDIRADIINDERYWNPLFKLQELTGFDVTQDFPCEVLHTILLGTVKYLARQTLKDMTANQKERLVQWLNEANMDGIGDGVKIRGAYMAKHVQSLVGKDLKRLCQVMHWALSHTDVDETIHLTSLLQRFYTAYTRVYPEALIKKPKLHVLSHAIEDIQRFGPLPIVSSERFESFNTIIRESSVLSNRKNASRDIARRVADEEMMCDLIAGASFMDQTSKTRRRVGAGISNMLTTEHRARKFFYEAYCLTRLAAHVDAGAVQPATREKKKAKLMNGDWAKAGDVVLLRNEIHMPRSGGDRSSTRVGIVQRLFRINGAEAIGQHQADAKLTIRPLWQRDGWDGWAYGPSATPLEEGTCSDVASADIIAVLKTNHNCEAMQCKPSADDILHLGDSAERVVNSSCFRSTFAVTTTMQRMRDKILTAQGFEEELSASKIASS